MGGSVSEAAAQVIAKHGLFALNAKCRCGWDDPDQAHAQHVLHQLQLAGIDVVWR